MRKRTVFPPEGSYEIDGVFLKKEEAFERLKEYIGDKQYERLLNIEDIDESESVFKSLYSLYDRTLQNKNTSKRLEERIDDCFTRGIERAKRYKKERVNFVVSVDNLFSIGDSGTTPWKMKDDRKHLEELTDGGILVMGYNTYKRVGHLLANSNREIRVLSKKHTKKTTNSNVIFYNSPKLILEKKRADYREIFVIGGQQVFELLFNKVTDIYITFVDTAIFGEATFPEIPFQYFETREVKSFTANNRNEFDMKMCHLRKKGKKEIPVKKVKYMTETSKQLNKFKNIK